MSGVSHGWWSLLMALLTLTACVAGLGERPALPTAIPNVSSKDETFATPASRARPTAPAGPTSTPAPWATPLPPAPPPPPSSIPHDLVGKSDCMYCHLTPASFGVPKDHVKRANTTCRGCHALSPSAPQPPSPSFKHSVAEHEACLGCHLRGMQGARAVPGDHATRTNEVCTTCHRRSS